MAHELKSDPEKRQPANLKKKGGRTREAIIDTAVSIISDKGIDGVSVLAITEQMKIRNSNFYYYFQNIDHLLEVAGHRVVQDLVKIIGSHKRDDPAACVAIGPLTVLAYADQHPQLRPILLRVLHDTDGKHADLTDSLREDLRWGRRTGRFAISMLDVAAKFCGILVASAVNQKQNGMSDPQLNELTAIHTLNMLGLTPAEADAIVTRELQNMRSSRQYDPEDGVNAPI